MTPEKIGRYIIEKQIGQGGMSVVYLAYDPKLNRQVAIKSLNAQQSGIAPEMIVQEARMLASLEHDHILPIYDMGEKQGQAYIVMRYIPNGSLKERVQKRPLSPQEASELLTKIATALQYAHENNVIHRDIKLSNILIDQTGKPLLADFGIAKSLDQTVTTTPVGSPPYMAPEQWQQKKPDERTDIYQLGIMLFEMLTGQRPFQAQSRAEYEQHHLLTPVPPLHRINSQLSPHLDEVIQKATAKEPAKRYQKVGQFAQAFAQAVAQAQEENTVTNLDAPPVSPHRRRLGWLGIGGVVGLILLAFGWWYGNEPTAVAIATPSPTPTLTTMPLDPTITLPPPTMTATERPSPTYTLPPPTATTTPPPTATLSPTPTHTPPPTNTPEPTLDPRQPPPNPVAGTVWQRPQDGMRLRFVPGGPVTIGADTADLVALTAHCALTKETAVCNHLVTTNSRPTAVVNLPDYWLDETEVSNQQYALCVMAGGCAPPAHNTITQYQNETLTDHPIIGLTWTEANSYCQWVGGQLPSEDQWEYAARGTARTRYPWGDQFNGNKLNFCDRDCPYVSLRETAYTDGYAETSPVGSYTDGLSWVQVLDLAGNVWEWTRSDRVDPDNPTARTGEKVIRGGSWDANSEWSNSVMRRGQSPDTANPSTGFRCAFTP